MLKINIIPLEKVNDVSFGTKREEVRKSFEKYGTPTEFKKNQFSKNSTDDYSYFHVFYNENDEFEAIEIFDNVKAYVNEKLIFPADIDTALKIFPDLEKDGVYYTSVSQSVGITTDEAGEIISILFGISKYYE